MGLKQDREYWFFFICGNYIFYEGKNFWSSPWTLVPQRNVLTCPVYGAISNSVKHFFFCLYLPSVPVFSWSHLSLTPLCPLPPSLLSVASWLVLGSIAVLVFPFLHHLHRLAGLTLYWPQACIFQKREKLATAKTCPSCICTSEWGNWIARIAGKVGGSQVHLLSCTTSGAGRWSPRLAAPWLADTRSLNPEKQGWVVSSGRRLLLRHLGYSVLSPFHSCSLYLKFSVYPSVCLSPSLVIHWLANCSPGMGIHGWPLSILSSAVSSNFVYVTGIGEVCVRQALSVEWYFCLTLKMFAAEVISLKHNCLVHFFAWKQTLLAFPKAVWCEKHH